MAWSKITGERVLISFEYALKHLLRNKVNYDVVEGFLSELLKFDIKVRNIEENESNRKVAHDDYYNYNRVDVLAEDTDGSLISIELQFDVEIDFVDRMLHKRGKVIAGHMRQDDNYPDIKKVYSINMIYFDLGKGTDYIYRGTTKFKGLHTEDELQLSEQKQKMFAGGYHGDIHPEYWILKITAFDDVVRDTLDEWIYFLRHNEIKDSFKAKGLARAKELLDIEKLTREEYGEYEYLQDVRSHKLSMMASARMARWEKEQAVEAKRKEERRQLVEALAGEDAALAHIRDEREKIEANIVRIRDEKKKIEADIARMCIEKNAVSVRERAEEKALLAIERAEEEALAAALKKHKKPDSLSNP
jgi:predicted transposase/invertase (TIGR01784 family)